MSSETADGEKKPIRLPLRKHSKGPKEELDYLQYIPDEANKNAITAQNVRPYFSGYFGDRYHLVEDRILDSVTWIFQFSDSNNSDNPKTIRRKVELGTTVTNGTEAETSLSVSAGYTGFGFSFNLEASERHKQFSTEETSKVVTFEEEYELAPHHSLFVYKKEYTFHGRIWLWDKLQNVRLRYQGRQIEGTYSLNIIADETSEWNEGLTKVGTLAVDPSDLIVPDGDWDPYQKGDIPGIFVTDRLSSAWPWMLKG